MPRVEEFVVATVKVSRGEALRAFIAAIYDAARSQRHFTTDDVFPRVQSVVPADALRQVTANSKLIAAALRKCKALGYITPTKDTKKGDDTCHARPKQVWESRVF
jgi:hypothetical protein